MADITGLENCPLYLLLYNLQPLLAKVIKKTACRQQGYHVILTVSTSLGNMAGDRRKIQGRMLKLNT